MFDRTDALPQITRTYNGRRGCACGCRGKYSTPAENPVSVRNTLRTIISLGARHPETGELIAPGTDLSGFHHIWAETDTRLYIAYFGD